MTAAILSTDGLGVRYGSFTALSEVSLSIRPNTIHSVIGPNGAGKTTLFHALTGRVRPSSGRIFFDGHDITALTDDRRVRRGIARSFQVTSLFHRLPVRENLRLAAQGRAPWQALSGVRVQGYEIHHGRTQMRADMQAGASAQARELLTGMLWQSGDGAVLGTYLHGLFENAAVIHALFGQGAPSLEQVFARLAKGVSQWFAPEAGAGT